MSDSFLCGRCRRAVCAECKSIADEYSEIDCNQKALLWKAQQQLEQAQQDAARATKRAEEYERLMKLGQHALMVAWMDSMTPAQLLAAVEKAAQR
jgi:hypothetical protein